MSDASFRIESPNRPGIPNRAELFIDTSDDVPGLGLVTIWEDKAATGCFLTPHQMDKVALDLIRRADAIRRTTQE